MVQVLGIVPLGAAVLWLVPAQAFATTPSVRIPSGPFTDGQEITVSGTGFPGPHQIPTGLQIYECTDASGQASDLPTDPDQCEGTTVSQDQINTDSKGSFTAQYPMALVTVAGGQAIDCDPTHTCVLWVGVDFNNAFLSGPHAFSTPFTVAPAASNPTTAAASATTVPSTSGKAGTPESGVSLPSTAATSGGTTGSLAFTGPPVLIPWLLGTGGFMAVAGAIGRRRGQVRLG